MSLQDAFRLLRPRQWAKNLAVFAGLIFSGSLGDLRSVLVVTLAFAALNMISGAIYAANDAIDAEKDRMHPIKRERPVASGRVSRNQAFLIAGVLTVAGLTLSVLLGLEYFAAVAGYLVLQVLYGIWFKHLAIVEMLVIAVGFVIRAVAGAVVIDVPVSPWLVLCTGLLALFLAAAKRRHELVLLQGDCGQHRAVLSEYSAELLDSFMVTLSAATVTSYALYTFFETRAPGYSMMLTIPLVIYGVLRYQLLVLNREGGGQPEEVLLGDRPIIACVGLWAASAVVVLYVLPAVSIF